MRLLQCAFLVDSLNQLDNNSMLCALKEALKEQSGSAEADNITPDLPTLEVANEADETESLTGSSLNDDAESVSDGNDDVELVDSACNGDGNSRTPEKEGKKPRFVLIRLILIFHRFQSNSAVGRRDEAEDARASVCVECAPFTESEKASQIELLSVGVNGQ
jgi:hypothetical protein